jgi:hypothetical protein
MSDLQQVLLPNDVIILIIKVYLSNYTWNVLMFNIANKNIDFLGEFVNIYLLKRVSKSVCDVFKGWNIYHWYFTREGDFLFDRKLECIREYIESMNRYFQKEITIVWDPGCRYTNDYEFCYDIKLESIDKDIKLTYEGSIYCCPNIHECIEGSALLRDGFIENELCTEFSQYVHASQKIEYVPLVEDILLVLGIIPGQYQTIDDPFTIYPELTIQSDDHSFTRPPEIFKQMSDLQQVLLPNDIIILIVNAYLSNYTWSALMFNVANKNTDYFSEFMSIISLKRVSTSIYDAFTEWNNYEWYFTYEDDSLFSRNTNCIEEYFNIMNSRYFQECIKISWDSCQYSGDYEFWYNVKFELIDKDIKISYEGYIYCCPHMGKCIEGSALVWYGYISDESYIEFSLDFGASDEIKYFPSIWDIALILDIPGNYQDMGNLFQNYSDVRIDDRTRMYHY